MEPTLDHAALVLVTHGFVAALALVAASSGCALQRTELFQVAGDTFSVHMPPPPAASIVPDPAAAGATSREKFATLVERWSAALAAEQVPGGAIAIVENGRLAFSAGVGVKRKGTPDPVTADSLFRVASASKMIIAAAMMKLVEAGRIDLDRPVTEYVPYFRRGAGYDPTAVTLHMALTHTAGLPDDVTVSCPVGPGALRDYFEKYSTEPLWTPPGRLFDYSNTGYALAAAAIAEVTQRPFEDVVAETIFTPAGMTTATFDPALAMAADHVVGHADDGSPQYEPNAYDCEFMRAPGGVMASVKDYAHFLEMLLADGGSVLTAESITAMEAAQVATQLTPERSYGYGLFSDRYKGLRLIGHPGGLPGFGAFAAVVPERRFGVVVLINAEQIPESILMGALDTFLGLADTPLPRYETPPSSWSQYVGTYDDAAGKLGRFSVSLSQGKLWMELIAGQTEPLPPTLTGTFFLDERGRAEYFVTRLGAGRRAAD
jgi:CubicO group peptidase (beta-lactamase class C family)